MTTFHKIILRHIALFYGYTPDENIEFARLLIRNAAKAATDHNAVAWIYEDDNCFWIEEDVLGTVIPAELARELIAEGRLNHPVMASTTVADRSSREEKN